MILDAMSNMELGLKDEMDSRFELFEKRVEKRIEESELHTRILIEDLEERVFGANTDQFSVHTDKIENYEVRITDLEVTPAFT